MMDLVEIEEDLGAEEIIFGILPPFHVKFLMESFQLAFQLHVKVCPGVISVHLNLVGPVLVLWGRVSGIHTRGMSRIADVTPGYNRMRCTMVAAGWLMFYNKIFSGKIPIKYFHDLLI